MGRGRQSRQKIADKVRSDRGLAIFEETYSRPTSLSPSAQMEWYGAVMGNGFRAGFEYADLRMKRKRVAVQRLNAQPLRLQAIARQRDQRVKPYLEAVAAQRMKMRIRIGERQDLIYEVFGTFEED